MADQDGFNRPEQALQAAYNAATPADSLSFAMVAIRLQQQQIAELEKSVAHQAGFKNEHTRAAVDGVVRRAKDLVEQARTFATAGKKLADAINRGELGQG
jgi:hypothetical protein